MERGFIISSKWNTIKNLPIKLGKYDTGTECLLAFCKDFKYLDLLKVNELNESHIYEVIVTGKIENGSLEHAYKTNGLLVTREITGDEKSNMIAQYKL